MDPAQTCDGLCAFTAVTLGAMEGSLLDPLLWIGGLIMGAYRGLWRWIPLGALAFSLLLFVPWVPPLPVEYAAPGIVGRVLDFCLVALLGAVLFELGRRGRPSMWK